MNQAREFTRLSPAIRGQFFPALQAATLSTVTLQTSNADITFSQFSHLYTHTQLHTLIHTYTHLHTLAHTHTQRIILLIRQTQRPEAFRLIVPIRRGQRPEAFRSKSREPWTGGPPPNPLAGHPSICVASATPRS